MSDERQKVALFSVLDKQSPDIGPIGKRLIALGWKIIGSKGTVKYLEDAGVPAQDVAELTGHGPILNHKVVTLSEPIHAGLLASGEEELVELVQLGFLQIDLVYVGLYSLLEEIGNPDHTDESVNNATDMGGVALLTSACKGGRIVVSDPEDWDMVLEMLEHDGVDDDIIKSLAAKAYFIVSGYRLASARYLGDGQYEGMLGELVSESLYGENAWQKPARLYSTRRFRLLIDPFGLDECKLIAGTQPSDNNWSDIDRLLQTITHITGGWDLNYGEVLPTAVAVKHGNPCGAAVNESEEEVLRQMVVGDPRAIFGGLVMINFRLTEELAEILLSYGVKQGRRILDGIIAPSFDPAAVEMLSRKKDKCRFVELRALSGLNKDTLDQALRFRYVRQGFKTQPNYTFILNFEHPEMKVYGERNLQAEKDLLFAWAIGSTSNSNTMTLAHNSMLIGNGVGRQDRVGAAGLAIENARSGLHQIVGAAVYSDSFIPFIDAIALLVASGVRFIFSTSGSIKDEDVQAFCQAAGVTLYQLPDKLARGFFGH